MKVPPKRKGNLPRWVLGIIAAVALNESPSEKEGKSARDLGVHVTQILPLNESPSEKEGKSNSQ